MNNINTSDSLELAVATFLQQRGIDFTHESQSKDQVLDFYLPAYDVYIEVKKYHTPRVEKQLASQDNVILVQGVKALEFLTKSL